MKKSQLDMYKENQNEIVNQYQGKIIAVKDGYCIQAFDSLVEASRAMKDKGFTEGDYLIIKCTPGNSEYSAFFANCIMFNDPCYA
jgi:hypothetical protein